MKTLKLIIVFALTTGTLILNAQQVPLYTHYMNNTLVVNPAYAGSRDALTLTALHRSQWVGFTGSPITQTITAHTPLRNEHIGLGLSILNDKIGPTNNTSVFVDYSYMIKLNDKSKLALGLSAGINIYNANLTTLQLDQQIDPSFQNNVNNHVTPNFGFGAYYSRERFYYGISIPDLLQNNYLVKSPESMNSQTGKEQRHLFFIAGALFNLSDNLGFKPTTLVKVTAGAPVQADLTATFIIMKRLLVGAMYRTGDSFGGLIGFDITDQLHLGYSYDWSYGLRTGTYNSGSNEILLRYDIIFLSRKQIHSPRNF